MNSQSLRFYLKVRFKLGLAINETYKELKTALTERHLSLYPQRLAFNKFKRGIGYLKDKRHKERGLLLKTIHG